MSFNGRFHTHSHARFRTRGQTLFMVMMMLMALVTWAYYSMYSASSQYAQSAQYVGYTRGNLFGRTASEAVTMGIQQGATVPYTGGYGYDPRQTVTPPPLPPPLSPLPIGPNNANNDPNRPNSANTRPPDPNARPNSGNLDLTKLPTVNLTDAMRKVISEKLDELYTVLKNRQSMDTTRFDAVDPLEKALRDVKAELGDLAEAMKPVLGTSLGTGVQLESAKAYVTNIRKLDFWPRAGVFDEKNYYREDAFKDNEPQKYPRRVPLHFAGDLFVTYIVKATVRNQPIRIRQRVILDVKVHDVYPMANEFALFSFGAPYGDEWKEYRNVDLNKGGFMGVLANGYGRIMLRGPMVLKVEDTAAQVGLGGRQRDQFDFNYPAKTDFEWAGLATVPGPRAVPMPYGNIDLVSTLGAVWSKFSGQGRTPILQWNRSLRPSKMSANIQTPLFGLTIPWMFLIGVNPDLKGANIGRFQNLQTGNALAGFLGVWAPIPLNESIAVAGTSSYFTGSIPVDEQKFSMLGYSKRARALLPAIIGTGANSAGSGGPKTIQWTSPSGHLIAPYLGMHIRAEDNGDIVSKAAPISDIPRYPEKNLPLRDKGATIQLGKSDVLVAEPFHYTRLDGGQSTGDATAMDVGVFGLYGLATYSRTIYWNFDVIEMIRWIKMAGIGLTVITGGMSAGAVVTAQASEIAAKSALQNIAAKLGPVGKYATLSLVPMDYNVKIGDPQVALASTDVDRLDAEKYSLAPFGLYYDEPDSSLFKELATDIALAGTGILFAKLIGMLTKKGNVTAAKDAAEEAATRSRAALKASGFTDDGVKGVKSLNQGAFKDGANNIRKTVLQNMDDQIAGLRSAGGTDDAIRLLERNRADMLKTFNNYADDSAQGVFKKLSQKIPGAGKGITPVKLERALLKGVAVMQGNSLTQKLAIALASNPLYRTGLSSVLVANLTAAGIRDNWFVETKDSPYANQRAGASKVVAAADQNVQAKDFPKGFLPPKMTYFPNTAGAIYDSLEEYFAQYRQGNRVTLALNGIIRVKKLEYDHPDHVVVYSGRGMIVGLGRSGEDAKVTAKFQPGDRGSANAAYHDHLTLVYEVADDGSNSPKSSPGQLIMGKYFAGTVYSTNGVRPADQVPGTFIMGNLICRNMYKQLIPDDKVVLVSYDLQYLKGLDDVTTWWTTTVGYRPSDMSSARAN